MRAVFRPMPGLTIVTLIALAILISLGVWQYQRLQWKTNLLAEIEQVADAPPFNSLSEVGDALSRGEPIDFRRIGVERAEIVSPSSDPFFVFTPQNRDISWRIYRPVRANGKTVFAALDVIADEERKGVSQDVTQIPLIGYVRLARESNGAAKSSPEKNRWFGFNPLKETHNWANTIIGGADVRFYIDTVPGALAANSLPPRRPNIRNNHFDYMLTWFGLAVTLFVIYLIMHRRAGRLGRI